jgi:hypothetical protein
MNGQNYIPLAPDLSTGGLSFQKWYGLSGDYDTVI